MTRAGAEVFHSIGHQNEAYTAEKPNRSITLVYIRVEKHHRDAIYIYCRCFKLRDEQDREKEREKETRYVNVKLGQRKRKKECKKEGKKRKDG